MARRGENIRKRKDGRWEGRYLDRRSDGTSRYRSVYARSYAEVKDKMAGMKNAPQSSTDTSADSAGQNAGSPAGTILFQAIAGEWLAQVSATRKYSTYIKYRSIYEKYLADRIGGKAAAEIDSRMLDVMVFHDTADCSDSLKKSLYSVLDQILHYGNSKYQIPVVDFDKKLSKKKKEIDIFNMKEQVKLMNYLHSNMDIFKSGIILCLLSGLRLGELCALKWEDIDFDLKIIHVSRTVQRIKAEGQAARTILYESVPKTAYSRREIPVSEEMILLLKKYRIEGEYLFCMDKAMEPRTYQKKLKSYLKSAGVRERNFHALRHTFATSCMENGMDVKSLSEILGHSDVRITLNSYVHPSMDTKRQHLTSLASFYGQYLGQAI